jgi:hypothetical protein
MIGAPNRLDGFWSFEESDKFQTQLLVHLAKLKMYVSTIENCLMITSMDWFITLDDILYTSKY